MTHPVDRMLALWAEPPPADPELALAAFRSVYADPYSVNGEDVPVEGIVDRVRILHAALQGLRHEVIDRTDLGARSVLVMMQTGRHVGDLPTPIGVLGPTGRHVARRLIEVITVHDDRLLRVWAAGDDLGRLARLDAVRLVQPAGVTASG